MAANGQNQQTAGMDTLHHEVLFRLISAIPETTSTELHRAYDAVAPLVYQGTTTMPVQRRRRRQILRDLEEAGVVAADNTKCNRVWVPLTTATDEEECSPPTAAVPRGEESA